MLAIAMEIVLYLLCAYIGTCICCDVIAGAVFLAPRLFAWIKRWLERNDDPPSIA